MCRNDESSRKRRIMTTPIFDFVNKYMEAGISRFHMPGHKGKTFLGPEPYDITEIDGADVLYSADGIINESENNASALFDTAHTFYSAEGSTLAIKAMLFLASLAAHCDGKPLVFAARNAHKAFIYGAAMLDIDVEWLYPDGEAHLCACNISSDMLEKKLSGAERKPCAVYITSPDYLGNESDIASLSRVCKKFGIPLLVDNAHGAYLNFLSPSRHPIALGATACSDSAHKTLPVLTGGAYLHVSKDAPKEFCENARHALSLFASTSPSYVILQSLDICNRYLSDGYAARLRDRVKRVQKIKSELADLGFAPEESEPLKIVIRSANFGYRGTDIGEILRACGAEAEFCDDEYIVLMITPENTEEDLKKLLNAFRGISPRCQLETERISLEKAKAVMPLRAAMLVPQELISAENAVGRICASPTVACPPAVPIVISGEVITDRAVKLFERYGIEKIAVIK